MSDDTQEIRTYPEPNLPYITIRRTRNAGAKDRYRKDKITKEKSLVAPGEYVEDWHWVLTNIRGHLFPFARLSEVTRKVQKGGKIVGYGNFNMVFDRMRATDDLVRELHSIEAFVQTQLGQFAALEAAKAETAAVQAKLARVIGEQHTAKKLVEKDLGDEGTERTKAVTGTQAKKPRQASPAGGGAPAGAGAGT